MTQILLEQRRLVKPCHRSFGQRNMQKKKYEQTISSQLYFLALSQWWMFFAVDFILKKIETSTIFEVESFAFKPGPDLPSTTVRDHRKIFLLQKIPELQKTTSVVTSILRKR